MARDPRWSQLRASRRELRDATDELRSARIAEGRMPAPGRAPTILLAVAICAALALAVVVVAGWLGARSAYSDADYRRAAADRVSLLLSPDVGRPDRARRVLAGATGSFADEFAQSADGYTEFVRQNGTVAAGAVTGTGVAARAGESAEVIVVADVRFSGGGPTAGDAARGDRRFRLRVVVTPEGGVLKLAAVQYLP
ncbi:hypothetical protein [Gordonia soli]|uniref:Mce-associated membrane protein n=1 Tax=Gordonia soli NBRC 108243 TaxID=1223545 RepID=M0QGU4_9ACTN|nr:hypothetical protein [Gordonia soli]GAC67778.1 hypothetical protein GS4_11_00460 [Gordonia soli NBRC 108243]